MQMLWLQWRSYNVYFVRGFILLGITSYPKALAFISSIYKKNYNFLSTNKRKNDELKISFSNFFSRAYTLL